MTRWSVFGAAAASPAAGVERAREHFCQAYWNPLYAYARARGASPADAQDSTQDFVLHFLESEGLERANSGRGRFRSFLRTAFRNYMTATWRRATADKRGGALVHVAMDSAPPDRSESAAAAMMFDRAWAQSCIDNAHQLLLASHTERGLEREFAVLGPFLTGDGGSTLKMAAEELGKSHDAVRRQLCRLRNEFRHLLREQVAAMLEPDEDLESELRYLVDCLRQAPPEAVDDNG